MLVLLDPSNQKTWREILVFEDSSCHRHRREAAVARGLEEEEILLQGA